MEPDLVPGNPLPRPEDSTGPALPASRVAVAPWWHTVALIVILLSVSALGAGKHPAEVPTRIKLTQYGLTIIWEWLLFLIVLWGVKKNGGTLRDLVGGRWQHFEDVLLDCALAAGFLMVWLIVAVVISAAMGQLDPSQTSHQLEEARKTLGFLAPRTGMELTLFVMLSCTAGICEETIFRGYLQKQFQSWSGNAAIAIFAQGLFFGAAHGYEGLKKMSLIAVLGILFGVLAHFRKSLRPGMIAHSSFDILQGLLMRALLK